LVASVSYRGVRRNGDIDTMKGNNRGKQQPVVEAERVKQRRFLLSLFLRAFIPLAFFPYLSLFYKISE